MFRLVAVNVDDVDDGDDDGDGSGRDGPLLTRGDAVVGGCGLSLGEYANAKAAVRVVCVFDQSKKAVAAQVMIAVIVLPSLRPMTVGC